MATLVKNQSKVDKPIMNKFSFFI